MIAEYKGQIAFRLSKEEREKVECLVQKGKFKNLSEVIREALRKFLANEGS